MTVLELLAVAQDAVANGDIEKAEEYTKRAKALQAIEAMKPAEGPSEESESIKALQSRIDELEKQPAKVPSTQAPEDGVKAANINKTGLGDDYVKAVSHYVRTGDAGALGSTKASTDDITSIAVDGNANYAVPTAHYQRIIEKRDSESLRSRLGLTFIPGVGTTANVTVDAAGDGLFVLTSEQNAAHTNNFDRDTPPVGRVTMTLQKFTKKVELTDEILEDEDARLMAFIEAYIGRGLANTWNNQIVTKAVAGATGNVTLASATAIATSEVPEVFYTLPDGYEDNASWIFRRSTEGAIRSLTGADFQFVDTPQGSNTSNKQLWTSPVYNSKYMAPIASTNVSMLFGDFSYLGYREAPSLTFIRDPYSVDGAVILKYYTRFVVEVLIGEALVKGTQAT